MRVTQRMLVRNALNNLKNSTQRLGVYQEQMASGKRINRPSDDPFGAEKVLNFRSELKALEVSKDNMELSQDWLNATDVTLDKLNDVLIRAKSIAIRGSDDSVGTEARAALSNEAGELIGSVIQNLNTSSQGRYLFAGYKVEKAPFVAMSGGTETQDYQTADSVQYLGDKGQIVRELEPGVSMTVNISGSESWLDSSGSGYIFNTLIKLRDGLKDPTKTNDVRNALQEIDSCITMSSQTRAVVGAKLQRLTDAMDKVESITIGMQELLSKVENTDMAETQVKYYQQDAVYKSALQVNARTLPVSLLDYLR